MENTMKISFSAVTHIGAARSANEDRIFANGKYLYQSAADYAQISFEVSDSKCFFALAESMEDDESGISLTNDLKKFHQKAKSSTKDIRVKLDELVQCVEQCSNLLHSVSLGENDFNEKKPSFAGVLIDEGDIAAVNLGNCRIYKLEGETFKLLVNDYKRAERLLKMGIISNEQAELLSGQQKASMDEGRATVKKSDVYAINENTTYLICSNGLTDSLSEDVIYDILLTYASPDEAAGKLVIEAVKNEAEENITAIVIKAEEAGETQAAVPGPRTMQYRAASGRIQPREARLSAAKRRNSIDIGRIVSVIVLVFLSAAVLFGGFKLWMMLKNPQARQTNIEQSSTSEETGTQTEPTDYTEAGEEEAPPEEEPDAGGIDGENTEADVPPSELVGEEGTTYIVKSGDMLMAIAKRFYGDESKYQLIMKANKITNPDMIAVGQKLIIPPAE